MGNAGQRHSDRPNPVTGVVVLEPRRLAARLLARRVAEETGTRLGDLVGYQTRDESVVSRNTRIRFVTDGVFLRHIRSNPTLNGVAAVVLDEFHERRIAMDLSLALCRTLLRGRRPDLDLLVMSATLDADLLQTYLDASLVQAHSPLHPVEILWRPQSPALAPWDAAAAALKDLLRRRSSQEAPDAADKGPLTNQPPGDVLVFMPGVYEIRRTIDACRRLSGVPPFRIFPLYGDLPQKEQDAALAPLLPGAPTFPTKVLVSTNVAETSITIPGVRHVIDSGLVRVNRHDVRRGLDVLVTVKTSDSSAKQRAGRAGRTAPGTCTRLWSEREHVSRRHVDEPEILRVDLSDAVLQLLSLDAALNPESFPWLTLPEPEALAAGLRLLADLGAVTMGEGPSLTPFGAHMAELPMHPRLARMLIEAKRRGCVEQAALWAALASEGAVELASVEDFDSAIPSQAGLEPAAVRQVQAVAERFRRAADRLTVPATRPQGAGASLCLLAAFPDHVASRRGDGPAYEMSGRRRCALSRQSSAAGAEIVVAVEVQERSGAEGPKTMLSLAVPVDVEDLRDVFPDRCTTRSTHEWNTGRKAVERFDEILFGDLVVRKERKPNPDRGVAAQMLAERIASGELRLELWDKKVEAWIDRCRCVADWFPERNLLRCGSEDLLLAYAEICDGATKWDDCRKRPCLPPIKALLSPADRSFVERMAPETLPLPHGRKLKLTYVPGQKPRGSARIQELFDLQTTPRVAGGRAAVVIELLAPNMRPVQVTEDLAGFWKNHYPAIKQQLQRRYPKHEWR